jgi:hypothetical protein
MAGEIIKGTVQANIISVQGATVGIVADPDGQKNFNEIAGYNSATESASVVNLLDDQISDIPTTIQKLSVDQGKSFKTIQVRFDANVVTANVANTINDRINEWISSTGSPRYDDFKLVINQSGLGNHDITTVIVRYF